MKQVIVNALLLHERHTGVERVLEEYLMGLSRLEGHGLDFEVFCSPDYAAPFSSKAGFQVRRVGFPARLRALRLPWEHGYLPFKLRGGEGRLYHAPSYILPRGLKVPSVVTCHDLISLEHPQYCRKRTRLYYQLMLPSSIRQASHVVAVSETVRESILNRFSLAPERVSVIPHGVSKLFLDPDRVPLPAGYAFLEERPFILFAGRMEAKKQVPMLLEAFARLQQKLGVPHRLVLAGQAGYGFREIQERIHSLGLRKSVVLTGFVPDLTLKALYQAATLFAFPSVYEGFGIPPLEAMACGTPCVVSNGGALPEVTGGVCPQVGAFDVEGWVEAMEGLLLQPEVRLEVGEKGRAWAQQFRWEVAAQRYVEVYQKLLE